MCTEVKIDGKLVDTIGELASIVGKENIVIYGYYINNREEIYGDEFCLCPVDIEATAERAGYEALPFNANTDWFYGPTLVKKETNAS